LRLQTWGRLFSNCQGLLTALMPNSDKLLELLTRSGPGLHALLTKLTLRQDVAEDLMQDLFIRLSGSNLDKVDNLDAYAKTVAINLAFDWRRKKGPSVSLDCEDTPEPAAEEKSPLIRMVENEDVRKVFDAMDRLNKVQRKVFVLRYIQQHSFEEIAEETGKTPHHVRALCSRALTKVRGICAKAVLKSTSGGDDHVEH
jgi:RNA polymerase sigma-70 factor (ECF subfamily)